MSQFVVDVESDNPAPVIGSIVCFGAVMVEDMSKTFYGQIRPITEHYSEDALAISGFTREEHLEFNEPVVVMQEFRNWINQVNQKGRPVFWSDNPAFDFQWINFYFHNFLGFNPFGWSGRRIGDLICGYKGNAFYKWKKHRKTAHDHHPVNDAKGNAEALWYIKNEGLKIKL